MHGKQFTGLENGSQVASIALAEAPRDLNRTVGDLVLDEGHLEDSAVKIEGQVLTDVLAGPGREVVHGSRVKPELHRPLLQCLVEDRRYCAPVDLGAVDEDRKGRIDATSEGRKRLGAVHQKSIAGDLAVRLGGQGDDPKPAPLPPD